MKGTRGVVREMNASRFLLSSSSIDSPSCSTYCNNPTTRIAYENQAAVSFVNDSLLTTVCLQYRPYDVAAAVVYLAHLLVSLPRVDVASLNTSESVVGGELGPSGEYRAQYPYSAMVIWSMAIIFDDGDGDDDDDDDDDYRVPPLGSLPSRFFCGYEIRLTRLVWWQQRRRSNGKSLIS